MEESKANNPVKPGTENINPDLDGEKENVFDDDNSEGKNVLGENPEQILYDKPETVEDANEIISDGNE